MNKVKCPDCHVVCNKMPNHKTIYKCPECGNLVTTADGDQLDIFRFVAG